jgi:broad specificity phosphatase PhoE
MGVPPAYLFVARSVQHQTCRESTTNADHFCRHGIRLDLKDPRWHLHSPTPYDPPLTYTGWQQAKTLGTRIASIIRDREAEEQAAAALAGRAPRKKRYRAVIHSSPYLRCIQTAIAISAGLAQDSTPFSQPGPTARAPPSPILSPCSRPTVVSDELEACPAVTMPKPPPIRRSVLRLDAFLGEWLSPSYFEKITPPPESVMMIAGAKAELLRREAFENYPEANPLHHSVSQNHLWSPVSRSSAPSPSPLDNMSSLSTSLHRTASLGAASGTPAHLTSIPQLTNAAGYVSPTPHWAINANQGIPAGYVAHARDACVDIDYQWDSMSKPLDWGGGGEFPEEWTALHKRMHHGLQRIVDWYSTAEKPTDMVTKTVARFGRKKPAGMEDIADEDDDAETEAIVIIVTHGAGCNSLAGALTHAPVLTDFGMASLTMAVRKPAVSPGEGRPSSTRGWASPERRDAYPPVYQLYDVKFVGSTDHLATAQSTPALSRASSMSPATLSRANQSTSPVTPDDVPFCDSFPKQPVSAHASVNGWRLGDSFSQSAPRIGYNPHVSNRGGITVGSGVTSFLSKSSSGLGRPSALGLWSPMKSTLTSFDNDEDEDDNNLTLNFGHEKHTTPSATREIKSPSVVETSGNGRTPSPLSFPDYGTEEPHKTEAPTTPFREMDGSVSESENTVGPLFGRPTPPDDADLFRDVTTSKRRWTVNDRG